MAKPKTPIDDALLKLPSDQRLALQSLREVILSVMPKAEEVIRYGVPMPTPSPM